LAERTSIELIARDRDGLYADASRQGAPQAKQIADRFHTWFRICGLPLSAS
jgi:transposase